MTTATRLHTDRAAAARASAALQAQTKAANAAAPAAAAPITSAAHLRQLAQEKHTSAQHLLRQYEQRCSAALQAQTKAANTAAPAATAAVATAAATLPSAHLRQLAQEKHTSAQHLLRQYEQRCSANPHTRFTEPVAALWEGYFALTKLAENYARMADEADATVHAEAYAGQLQSTAMASTTRHPAAAHAA